MILEIENRRKFRGILENYIHTLIYKCEYEGHKYRTEELMEMIKQFIEINNLNLKIGGWGVTLYLKTQDNERIGIIMNDNIFI